MGHEIVFLFSMFILFFCQSQKWYDPKYKKRIGLPYLLFFYIIRLRCRLVVMNNRFAIYEIKDFRKKEI